MSKSKPSAHREYTMQPVVWIKAGVGAVLLSLLLSLGPITWRAAVIGLSMKR